MSDASADLHKGQPVLDFASQRVWEDWLQTAHASSRGVWLKIAKKDSGEQTVSYAEALEGALIFGWIDGQKARYDERFWLQRFTPRSPRSRWSQINRDKAERLLEQGRLTDAGIEQVEKAKADGRWEAAYQGQRTAEVPEDLERDLQRNPAAREFFAALDRANRYAILYRLQEAQRPETRARRLKQFVSMLNEGRRIHE